ncbi:MAG TPA: ComF family protein [Usitatibacter sp.]|nr:ComF family protein [Usitatibacter sp.]
MGRDCALCRAPGAGALVCEACGALLPAAEPAEGFVAAFDYRFPADRLVQRFKFEGDLAIGRWIALQLAARVATQPRPDALVAPPLSRARLRERGFNQSLLLARAIGRELGVPVLRGGIERVRDTPPQRGLGRGARRANVRGAFRCARRLDAMRIAIVDDVLTTGATASSLAAALRAAGAADVAVWAVAHARSPGSA